MIRLLKTYFNGKRWNPKALHSYSEKSSFNFYVINT